MACLKTKVEKHYWDKLQISQKKRKKKCQSRNFAAVPSVQLALRHITAPAAQMVQQQSSLIITPE